MWERLNVPWFNLHHTNWNENTKVQKRRDGGIQDCPRSSSHLRRNTVGLHTRPCYCFSVGRGDIHETSTNLHWGRVLTLCRERIPFQTRWRKWTGVPWRRKASLPTKGNAPRTRYPRGSSPPRRLTRRPVICVENGFRACRCKDNEQRNVYIVEFDKHEHHWFVRFYAKAVKPPLCVYQFSSSCLEGVDVMWTIACSG